MVKAIREASRTPVQRNTFYEPIRIAEARVDGKPTNPGESSGLLEKNLATA
jgi:hypothetical protein